jgi:hypothetical protein
VSLNSYKPSKPELMSLPFLEHQLTLKTSQNEFLRDLVLNTKNWPGQSKLEILQSLLMSYMKNFSTLKHLSTIPTTLLNLIFLPLHI